MDEVPAQADAAIGRILEDPELNRAKKAAGILMVAAELPPLSANALKLIGREFIGMFGSEYFQNPDGYEESRQFYQALLDINPSDGRIMCHLANLLLLENKDEEALRLYNQAFLTDPFLHYGQPGYLADVAAAANDTARIKFQVTLLQCYVLDGPLVNGDLAEMVDMYHNLISEFGAQHPVVQALLSSERIHKDLLPVLEEYAKKS